MRIRAPERLSGRHQQRHGSYGPGERHMETWQSRLTGMAPISIISCCVGSRPVVSRSKTTNRCEPNVLLMHVFVCTTEFSLLLTGRMR